MRKYFLFLIIIASGLVMSSCLGDTSRSYAQKLDYVYITYEGGITYGRTLTNRLITSNEIEMMMPGTFQSMNYSFEEENGVTSISIGGQIFQVDNVDINGTPDPIDKYGFSSMPYDIETSAKFIVIMPYAIDNPIYFDDHWIIECVYSIKKGEKLERISFYINEESESSLNEVKIDVMLEISGTPETNATPTTQASVVALDMARIRSQFGGTSLTEEKALKIKFNYNKVENSSVSDQFHYLTVKG